MSFLVLSALALSCAALPGTLPNARSQEYIPRSLTPGQPVSTTSGHISGHAAPHAFNVSEYLGISYAHSPTGSLRWLAPQPLNSSTNSYNATSFGATCASNGILGNPGITGPAYPYSSTTEFGPQGISLLDNEAQANYPSSEDCLTLNIWAPAGNVSGRAVMLWLYGGGFNFGSDQDPWYNGQYLASAQDVVVVTANYRTNIFGFPGAPNLPRQNLGLLDQRLAIEWVRDNIAGFGGSPSRITLFGQSAGASSVDLYSFAYANESSDPIVAGLIMQSGTVFREMPKSAEEAGNDWYEASMKLGCGNEASGEDEVLTCMRTKSTSQILTANGGAAGLPSILTSTTFGPVVDGIVAFDDYDARAENGQILKRPLLIGNADDEAGIAQPVAQGLSGEPIPQPVVDLINQGVFACPTVLRAGYQVKLGQATWRYRWFGQWANTVVAYNPATGAYHESDIPVVFGTTEVYGGANSAVQEAIIHNVQGGFAAFAKDPVNGLIEHGWPKYDGTNNLLLLAKNNVTGPNAAPAAEYDTGCPLVNFPDTTQAIIAEIIDQLKASA